MSIVRWGRHPNFGSRISYVIQAFAGLADDVLSILTFGVVYSDFRAKYLFSDFARKIEGTYVEPPPVRTWAQIKDKHGLK